MDPFPNTNNCIIFPVESKMKSIDETNRYINIRYSTVLKNVVIPPTIEVLHLTRIFVSLINKNNLYISIVTTGFVNLTQLEISGKKASVRGCLR